MSPWGGCGDRGSEKYLGRWLPIRHVKKNHARGIEMQALQLHWYEVLVAVILFVIWTALQLLMKPKEENESELEGQEPIDTGAYVKCQGEQMAETLRWKRFNFD